MNTLISYSDIRAVDTDEILKPTKRLPPPPPLPPRRYVKGLYTFKIHMTDTTISMFTAVTHVTKGTPAGVGLGLRGGGLSFDPGTLLNFWRPCYLRQGNLCTTTQWL